MRWCLPGQVYGVWAAVEFVSQEYMTCSTCTAKVWAINSLIDAMLITFVVQVVMQGIIGG